MSEFKIEKGIPVPDSTTTAPLVSDEEIERVHGNANFGSLSKRKVVNDGVLKTAMGFSMGHTQLCILMEHGLVKTPKPGRYETSLTKKGFKYLHSVFRYADIEKLAVEKNDEH